MTLALICGCLGAAFEPSERAFIREAQPWGLILFKRNVVDRPQLRALTDSFRDLVGRADAPVLIDQEGGTRAAHGAAALARLSRRRALR